MVRKPISALLITYNEEKVLPRCLASLLWADEIVLLDAESTDRTAEICLSESAPWRDKMKFHKRKWSGFKDQRNACLQAAQNDWVLVLDADECCSDHYEDRTRSSVDRSAYRWSR